MLAFFTAAEVTDLLRAAAPACKEPEAWGPFLSKAMFKFAIANDREFVAAFLAQLLVESGELNQLAENLNYSAPRLCAVWPKRFPSLDVAIIYAHKPRELANHVYGGRLGNVKPDDGWRYRGRGGIMTTGLDNYRRLQMALGIPVVLEPHLLETKEVAALSAAWFWWEHRLNFLAADLPDDDQAADFLTITRRVNGGTHGLTRRQEYRRRLRAHLGISAEAHA